MSSAHCNSVQQRRLRGVIFRAEEKESDHLIPKLASVQFQNQKWVLEDAKAVILYNLKTKELKLKERQSPAPSHT